MAGFGTYTWDNNGLPVYRYIGKDLAEVKDKTGLPSGQPDSPCFILGNYRITAFAHVSGKIELISGERGWARINHGQGNSCENHACVVLNGKRISLTDTGAHDDPNVSRTFGIGFARYETRLTDDVIAIRTVSSPPSAIVNEGAPGLVFSVRMENRSAQTVGGQYREVFPINYCMLSAQADQSGQDPTVIYENDAITELGPEAAAFQIRFHPQKLLIPAARECDSHPYDCFPPAVFLKGEAGTAHVEENSLIYQKDFSLAPGEAKELRFVLGLSYDGKAKIVNLAAELESSHASWIKKLPDLSKEPDETLRWEMLWNTYILECMATYNRYFHATYIPQGSVYAYRLGQNASGRDHCQHLLPMVHTDPELAKSGLRYALEHECPDGRIIRQDVGFGYEDADIYMESDAQLYIFMAVSEYILTTRDHEFLNEMLPYYPIENGQSGTVFEHLLRAFVWLRDVVRCGRHGLLRMLNSDWSDSFFHPYSPNRYLGPAESHLNTTMALSVLTDLCEALDGWRSASETDARLLGQLQEELRVFRNNLYAAFMKDMEGRIYAPRCYIGYDDDPKLRFGEDKLCIEPQTWLLQLKDFPQERKLALWEAIRSKVLDMEPYGARTREQPLWDEEGHGEDGGIWFSHQGALIKGVMTFSKSEAEKLLHKLTFRHFAHCYPDYWVGQWTAADSLESTLSCREGLYHFWTDHAFQPFCAHAHAWMLYCYCRLRQA